MVVDRYGGWSRLTFTKARVKKNVHLRNIRILLVLLSVGTKRGYFSFFRPIAKNILKIKVTTVREREREFGDGVLVRYRR